MAEAEGFQPGDLVQLKSGGPTMTFEGLEEFSGNMVCGYFVGTEYREITVSPAALVKVTDEELKQEQEAKKRLGEKPI